MFLPLYDDCPLDNLKTPWATRLLILANIAVYALCEEPALVGETVSQARVISFGMVPAVVTGAAQLPVGLQRIPADLTLLTYMFLHVGWLHLFANMAFLWVFGDNVEDAMGSVRFVAFYLACGVAGGVAHLLSMPTAEAPLVGASGAVAGCVSAYVLLHPRVKLWVLFLMRIPLHIPARWAIGAWIAMQLANGLLISDDSTAWWAHIGGIVAGAALIVPMRRAGVPLFGRRPNPEPSGAVPPAGG